MKNVLVTGGAGYLGSILVPALLKNGYHVTVVDNFLYQQTSLLDCCYDLGLEVVRGDARDALVMQPLVKKSDVIIPLACLVGAPVCQNDSIGAHTTNYEAIKFLLEWRSPEQPIIFPTTNSGYGVGEKGKFCTEKTPLRPISLYGKLKVEAEKALLDSGNVITLRLATVFGISPRMRLDLLVNDFTYRALYDRFLVLFEAHFKRNFIHVRDAAQAFLHCLAHYETMKNEPYNVGFSNANLSKWELCEIIQKILPDFYFTQARVGEDPDKRDYIVSNEKIEKTGYDAKVPVEDGIVELIKGYQIVRNRSYRNF